MTNKTTLYEYLTDISGKTVERTISPMRSVWYKTYPFSNT